MNELSWTKLFTYFSNTARTMKFMRYLKCSVGMLVVFGTLDHCFISTPYYCVKLLLAIVVFTSSVWCALHQDKVPRTLWFHTSRPCNKRQISFHKWGTLDNGLLELEFCYTCSCCARFSYHPGEGVIEAFSHLFCHISYQEKSEILVRILISTCRSQNLFCVIKFQQVGKSSVVHLKVYQLTE